ncbi:glutathione S-transferase family protein [Sphingobium aromaticiconvertens]|uniref:glutathione S-transferase family protein n=1 Tax=Sphingobium aromaticiconvertens TaxID=365341 RepID=UPI0030176B25
MRLFYHPLSSYCWKVLIALYENGAPFEGLVLDNPQAAADLQALWPIARFPLLRDEQRGATVAEASIIIEYLGVHYPTAFTPIPMDVDSALEVRLMDRLFDNYVMTPMQAFVADRIRPDGTQDRHGVGQARTLLGKAYALLEERIAGRTWAAGEAFTLADCAALPALFYADKVVPFRASHPVLAAYLARLEARPSVARVLAEKEPVWAMFPFADGPPV